MRRSWINFKSVVYFILTMGMPLSLSAGYTSYCADSASDLESAARRYESEKSNYESACSSYGYNRNDEGACGTYGYVTNSYRNATQGLKRAITEVYNSCGSPDDNRQYMRALVQAQKEITELKARLTETEKELGHLKARGTDYPPASAPVPDQPLVPIR